MKYHYLGEIFSVNQDWKYLSIMTFNTALVYSRGQQASCVSSVLLFVSEQPGDRNHFLLSVSIAWCGFAHSRFVMNMVDKLLQKITEKNTGRDK